MAILNPEQREIVTLSTSPQTGKTGTRSTLSAAFYPGTTDTHKRASLLARQSNQLQGSCVTLNVALYLSEGWTIQAVLREKTRLLLPPARHPACGSSRLMRTEAERDLNDIHHAPLLGFTRHLLRARLFLPKIELRMVGCRPRNPTSPLNTMAVEAQPPPTLSPSGFGQDTHTRIHTSIAGLVLERQVKSRSNLFFVFVGYLNHNIDPLHLVNLMPWDESPPESAGDSRGAEGPDHLWDFSHQQNSHFFVLRFLQVLRGSHSSHQLSELVAGERRNLVQPSARTLTKPSGVSSHTIFAGTSSLTCSGQWNSHASRLSVMIPSIPLLLWIHSALLRE